MMVNTVLGPVAAEALGQTLMHEHITCADWSMRMNFGDKFLQYDKLVEMAAGQLKKLKEYGVTTFVDGTAVNLGRDIHLLRDVSERSGVNVVASSGFYYQEEAGLGGRGINPGRVGVRVRAWICRHRLQARHHEKRRGQGRRHPAAAQAAPLRGHCGQGGKPAHLLPPRPLGQERL